MNLRDKRVLITGGAGFIGSHLARRLAQAGAKITLVSQERVPWRLRGMKHIRYERLSVTSPTDMRRVIGRVGPHIVYHLAALIPAGHPSAADLARVTVRGTKNVFEACARGDVRRFISMGTADEYGKSTKPSESSRARTLTPYGIAKKRATEYLRRRSKRGDISVTVVRAPIAFGPAQSFGMFVPNCIRSTILGEPFTVMGGEIERDFLYIDDLVDALVDLAAPQKTRFEIINVGSGRSIALIELARMIMRSRHSKAVLHVKRQPRSPHEPASRLLSIGKARRMLGWRPRTPLARGIKSTYEWYSKHRSVFARLTP